MSVLHFFWGVLVLAIGGIVVYAWVAMRQRIRKAIEVPPPHIDDEDIRRIEEDGALHTDDPEPLDLERIRKEEEEFWGETWDEAEEL